MTAEALACTGKMDYFLFRGHSSMCRTHYIRSVCAIAAHNNIRNSPKQLSLWKKSSPRVLPAGGLPLMVGRSRGVVVVVRLGEGAILCRPVERQIGSPDVTGAKSSPEGGPPLSLSL